MEAIILAGGFGTRLCEVVSNVPKPMASIGNRPFLEILLSSLSNKGFSRIILSLGFMAETIIKHFGNHFREIELVYVIENQPLGTGGAVRLALEQCRQNHIFVFNGDTFLDLEIEKVEKQWNQNKTTIIVGREIDDTSRYGRLMVNAGKVTGFAEKGFAGRGIINAGCYVLQNKELESFPLHTNFSLETDYFAKTVENYPIDLFITSGKFIDIGIPEDYQKAQTELLNWSI